MAEELEYEYTIAIDYDDFVTRFDLDEILSSIDRIIEEELLSGLGLPFYYRYSYPFGYPFQHREEPALSYVGITAVDRGSILLTVVASTTVAAYVARRFKKGVDGSLLADELERSGRLAGDLLGTALSRLNDWAERYVPKQRELGGKVKSIRVARKPKPKNGPKP